MSTAPHRTTSRGGGRAKPTHCPQGHVYSPENSGTRGNGMRYRTAARFLRGTTLMNADGTIDRHGYSRQPRRTRKRTVKV
jgi:hypothetical protein